MTEVELRSQIEKLQLKLRETLEENKKLAEDVQDNQATVVYQSKPEKTLKKFKEDDDVSDWIDTAKRHVNKFKKEEDKVDMLLNFLDRKPRLEVKFRIRRDKATADEVFTVLEEIYGLKDSLLQLEKEFYSRNQELGEDLADYSLALMEILMNMEKKKPDSKDSTENKLKCRFADGVKDVALRRELNRLNKERPRLRFYELRDEALEWCKKDDQSTETTSSESVSTQETANLNNIMQLIQEQQSQIQRLTETQQQSQYHRGRGHYRGRGRSSYRGYYNSRRIPEQTRTTVTQPTDDNTAASSNPNSESQPIEDITCRYCGQKNHIERFCIKKRRDQRNGQQSSNWHHSR